MRKFFWAAEQPNRYIHLRNSYFFVFATLLVLLSAFPGQAQEQCTPTAADIDATAADGVLGFPSTATRAAAELKAEEQQRVLGVMPNFNTTNIHDAAPLSAGQKFQLALAGEIDPFTFVAAGMTAGLSQWQKGSASYGMGAEGYAKRFGAAYLDAFDGAMIGNALLPAIMHQDPRYFRQGIGSFGSRFMHALASTWRAKNDDGKWTWNYSNLLGNIAAGGISNLYYSPNDRGVGPTFSRTLEVTAEGTVSSVFFEFWPDISHKLLAKKKKAQESSTAVPYTGF